MSTQSSLNLSMSTAATRGKAESYEIDHTIGFGPGGETHSYAAYARDDDGYLFPLGIFSDLGDLYRAIHLDAIRQGESSGSILIEFYNV